MKKDLVRIDWLDADAEAGWCPDDPDADQNGVLMPVFGILVGKGKNFATISHGRNPDSGEWLSKHRIPVGMIQKITVIRKVEI